MADIKITDITLDGKDLFDNDEDFMDELGEDVFEQIKGGSWLSTIPIPTYQTPHTPAIL